MPSLRVLQQVFGGLQAICNASIPCSPIYCCSVEGRCMLTLDSCIYLCEGGRCTNSTTPTSSTPIASTAYPSPSNTSTVPESPLTSSRNTVLGPFTPLELGIAVGGGAILLAVLAVIFFCCLRMKWKRSKGFPCVWRFSIPFTRIPKRRNVKGVSSIRVDPLDIQVASEGPRSFAFNEIEFLTSKFSDDCKVGEGGFGTVYRVVGPKGEPWAVKRAKRGLHKGREAFEREVLLIWRMNHRNLVSLVGWCSNDEEQILVYEYVHNGDLAYWIHGDGTKPPLMPLNVEYRLKIAATAARGLAYLHDQTSLGTCVHRDVKSPNILLDEKMEAKVADFGLSKLVPSGGSSFYTDALSGTRGYLDPEYIATHKVSPAIDVYSFGVVLLELLTGRKPILVVDSSKIPVSEDILGRQINNLGDRAINPACHVIPPGCHIITISEWVRSVSKNGDFSKIIDPTLEGSTYHMKHLLEFGEVAAKCTEKFSHKRPTMHEVNLRLESIYRNVAPISPPLIRRHVEFDSSKEVEIVHTSGTNSEDIDVDISYMR